MNISNSTRQGSPEVVTFGESMALLIAEGGKGSNMQALSRHRLGGRSPT